MDIEEGPIWAVLREKAPDRAPLIKSLAEEAAGKLRLVRDTFPTYTLHDEVHAANVVRLMGDLLGERAADLSGLEAAMLILAAYYHDIGMVYRPEELDRIPDEPEFKSYLRGRPQEFLAVRHHDGRPPLSVVENYCRHRHADRVYDHLARVSDRLMWEETPIYKALGDLCRSHNLPAADLRADTFEPDFLGECDLRLCALLLRLADILDLDSSRTPRSIYEHLSLAARATARTARSDDEWRKHLCAGGFKFPAERPPNYVLLFRAGPEHPTVEHDLRAFLDVVDDELRRCRPILDACALHWRGLSLPGGVDRRYIIGKHYTYGEFRFELDRAGVLELFMGERLYEDPYVFVRELLQNAIDATRLRSAFPDPVEAPEVAVTCWQDADGFLWVRVDDDGTGMDEHTLREYFLRVGRSYYESAELRADLALSGHGDEDFVAVSRFGIGVLSCFIAGDQVELSTRRILPDGRLAEPLRLSLARDEEFFVLRERPHPPTPMPRRGGAEREYRLRPGTSIAVRIDPTKVDVTTQELAKRIDRYVHCPPVPVSLNGRPGGDPFVDDLDRPRFDAVSRRVRTTTRSRYRGSQMPYRGALEIGRLPIDLTSAASTPKLRGQLVVIGGRVPAGSDGQPVSDLLAGWSDEELGRVPRPLRDMCRRAALSHRVNLRCSPGEIGVAVTHHLDREIGERIWRELEPFRTEPTLIGHFADAIEKGRGGWSMETFTTVRSSAVRDLGVSPSGYDPNDVCWSHNGLRLPSETDDLNGPPTRGLIFTGHVGLRDHLRPDLTISRLEIRSVAFEIHSVFQYALRRAARAHEEGPAGWLVERVMEVGLIRTPPSGEWTMGRAMADRLVADDKWDREAIIPTARGLLSAAEIRRLAAAGDSPTTDVSPPFGFTESWFATDALELLMAQIGLDLAWVPDHGIRLRSAVRPDHPAGLRRFAPMFFLPYEGPRKLLVHKGRGAGYWTAPINAMNPLARWLVDHADALAVNLPPLFSNLRRTLWPDFTTGGASEINRLLERIAAARPDLAPPPEAYLRDKNPEGEWWTR